MLRRPAVSTSTAAGSKRRAVGCDPHIPGEAVLGPVVLANSVLPSSSSRVRSYLGLRLGFRVRPMFGICGMQKQVGASLLRVIHCCWQLEPPLLLLWPPRFESGGGVLTFGTLPQRARAESDVVIGLGPVGLLPLSITCISIWDLLVCVGTWTAIYVFSINLRRSSASFLG